MQAKVVALELAQTLERELINNDAIAEDIDPWREDPLPFAQFAKEHLGIELWPAQVEDFEAFLGNTVEDTKRLFTQDPPTSYNCAALVWGKGCLGADEQIKDYRSGETRTVKEWAELGVGLLVLSWDGDRPILSETSPVYLKGQAQLYRITLEDGRSFVATAEHKCLSPEGWLRVGNLLEGHTQLLATPPYSSDRIADSLLCNLEDGVGENQPCEQDDRSSRQTWRSPQLSFDESNTVYPSSLVCFEDYTDPEYRNGSLSSHESNGAHGTQTALDSQCGCHPLPRSCDARPREDLNTSLNAVPSQVDAPSHSRMYLHEGENHEALSLARSHSYRLSYRCLANTFRAVVLVSSSEHRDFSVYAELSPQTSPTFDSVQLASSHSSNRTRSPATSTHPCVSLSAPHSFPHINYSCVSSIKPVDNGDFYDLTVPGTHCYFDAQGILHHNSGKDLISSTALVWFIHILLCLHNPQKFLQLEESEPIDIALASPTLRQTRRITFTKFRNRLKNWPWLRSLLPELGVKNSDRYLKKATEAADFVELPHKIRIHNIPLDAASAEGFNMIAFILSEFAGMESEASAATATQVLESFMSSGRTRYQKAWKGFLASFPRSTNDPQEQLITAKRGGSFPELYVVRRATWEVHPNRTFEDFASDFERNPEDSWAKYGARPRAAIDAYFRSPHLLILHASGAPMDLIEEKLYPVRDELQLTDAQYEAIARSGTDPILEVNQFGDPILDKCGFPRLALWFRGQKDPEGNPYDYYVHLDPGLSGDAYAFVMGHIHKLPDGGLLPTIDLAFRWTGSMFYEFGEIKRPAWFPDTLEQVEIVNAAEVDFRTVREFLFFLRERRKFNIDTVSFDNWNSVESIQALRKRDFNVVERTVTKEDYDEFKAMVYSRQLRYYARRVMIEEAYKLQILNASKVEAPRTKEGDSVRNDSHKDITDGMAAVCRRMELMRDQGISFAELPGFEAKEETPNPAKELGGLTSSQSTLLNFLNG